MFFETFFIGFGSTITIGLAVWLFFDIIYVNKESATFISLLLLFMFIVYWGVGGSNLTFEKNERKITNCSYSKGKSMVLIECGGLHKIVRDPYIYSHINDTSKIDVYYVQEYNLYNVMKEDYLVVESDNKIQTSK